MPTETREEVDPFLEEGGDEPQTQQPVAPAKPTTDPVEEEVPETKPNDDIKKAVAEAFKEHAPKPQVAPPKEMTEAEKREFWKIFDPEKTDPKFFNKFFNLGDDADELTLKERKALFGQMQEGLMRQALTAVNYMMDQRMKQVDERLTPLQDHYTQERSKAIRNNFNESYPALADKKFDKVLRLSATALADQEFDSQEAYFKALADHAADSIKAFVPDFDIGAPQTKPTPGTAPKTPRSRVGGTGGTGTGSAPVPVKTSKDDSDSIF